MVIDVLAITRFSKQKINIQKKINPRWFYFELDFIAEMPSICLFSVV